MTLTALIPPRTLSTLSTLTHLLGAALLLAATPNYAEAVKMGGVDKFGFKGVELGANLAVIASNPKYECRTVTTPIADKVCSLRKHEVETIAGAPIDSLFYFFDASGLTGIVLSLPETHFQPVVSALTEKYGTPTLKTEILKSLKGVTHENRLYHWPRPGASLKAERFSGRLDKSSIRIIDDGAVQRNQQRRALIAQDPRKDL